MSDEGIGRRVGRVLVLGGGLAGITAALDCAEAGAQVTLLEVRPQLGGAAYSFERDGLWLDNGQHVFLRCYTAYRALLERLGSLDMVHVQPRFEIPVLHGDGRRALLRRNSLPAPLHLAGVVTRYPLLSPGQRRRAARAALALARLDVERARELERAEGVTFGQWLREHGQDEQAIAMLWNLVALPALNVPADEGSLALAAFTMRTGLLQRNDAGDIGFHLRSFRETISEPAERALRAAGVETVLGARAEAVVAESGGDGEGDGGGRDDDNGQAGGGRRRLRVRAGGDELEAEAVVCAIPHMRAAELLEPLLGEEETGRWRRLGTSPIVNVHVLYDREVCEVPFAAGVGTPVQYVFDRTEAVGLADGRGSPGSAAGRQRGSAAGRRCGSSTGGQCLAISLSGAVREMAMDGDSLRSEYVKALAELFPRAREATVREVYISREHAATFRAAPGVDALRPAPRTSIPGLVLAGAWTGIGWPATLEAAVRSGHAAAREALG